MELWEKRLEICKKCPLWQETDAGPRCNKRKWINEKGEWSWLPKEGYKQGCSCLLEKAVHDPQKKCVGGKW